MNTSATTEYAVHLVQQATNGTEKWQAFVEALPQIRAEGESCEAVLHEIGQKLSSSLANGITSPEDASTLPSDQENLSSDELVKLEAEARAKGHKYYGIFAGDPGAMEVFEEIERSRDEHTIGG